jgi:hypothetical protein
MNTLDDQKFLCAALEVVLKLGFLHQQMGEKRWNADKLRCHIASSQGAFRSRHFHETMIASAYGFAWTSASKMKMVREKGWQ